MTDTTHLRELLARFDSEHARDALAALDQIDALGYGGWPDEALEFIAQRNDRVRELEAENEHLREFARMVRDTASRPHLVAGARDLVGGE